jgi:hypothetical protein
MSTLSETPSRTELGVVVAVQDWRVPAKLLAQAYR